MSAMHLRPSANYLAWKDASERLRAAEAAFISAQAGGSTPDPQMAENLERLRRETRVHLGIWLLEMQNRTAAASPKARSLPANTAGRPSS